MWPKTEIFWLPKRWPGTWWRSSIAKVHNLIIKTGVWADNELLFRYPVGEGGEGGRGKGSGGSPAPGGPNVCRSRSKSHCCPGHFL